MFISIGLVLAPATSSAGVSGKHSSGNNVLQNAYIARGKYHHRCHFTVFIVFKLFICIIKIHRPRQRNAEQSMVVYDIFRTAFIIFNSINSVCIIEKISNSKTENLG